MLKQLRHKKTAKKILWILAAVVIISFVFWGINGIVREKRKISYAGKIFGRKIGLSEYTNSFLAVKTQVLLKFGENIEQLEKYLNLPQEAWDRLILLNEAGRKKIKVMDNEVVETLEKIPIFQKGQSFNIKVYNYMLSYISEKLRLGIRITARNFEENLRDSLKITKLYERVTADAALSDEEIEAEYKKANEEIKVEYVSFSPADFKTQAKIDDNQESEDKSYTRAKEKAQETAKELKEALKKDAGTAISGLLKSSKLEIKETPFFKRSGFIEGIGTSKEFVDSAFGLAENTISDIIEVNKIFYIILQVKELRGINKEKFAQEREEFKNELLARKKEEIFMSFLRELRERANLQNLIGSNLDMLFYK